MSTVPQTITLTEPCADEPPAGGAFEQLRLRYWDAIDPEAYRPRRALWRELLALVRIVGPTQHLAFLLDSYSDDKGRAHVARRTLADVGGLSVATVRRGLAELKRVGIIRAKRTRGASHYALNLGGNGFASRARGGMGHTDPSRRVTQTLLEGSHRPILKKVRTEVSAAAAAEAPPTPSAAQLRGIALMAAELGEQTPAPTTREEASTVFQAMKERIRAHRRPKRAERVAGSWSPAQRRGADGQY